MQQGEVLTILKEAGGLLTDDHFIYSSGKHGSTYINKDAVYAYTDKISKLCRALAERFVADGVETVCGPTLGGIVLSQWTARHLSDLAGKEVLSVFAEKTNREKDFALTRGYRRFVAGKRVLVVEDVITTGASVRKVIEVVKDAGGEVAGVGVMGYSGRVGVTAEDLGAPKLETLLTLDLEAWDAKDCPLCARGVPINTTLGKGKNVA